MVTYVFAEELLGFILLSFFPVVTFYPFWKFFNHADNSEFNHKDTKGTKKKRTLMVKKKMSVEHPLGCGSKRHCPRKDTKECGKSAEYGMRNAEVRSENGKWRMENGGLNKQPLAVSTD